jgi:multidrug efflux pump subunit AcrB
MWIIKLSLKNPYVVATVVAVLVLGGLLALAAIPVDILPVLRANAVEVLTYYQGMPAESVERTMTTTVERYVHYGVGVERVESKSTFGVSQCTVYFQPGVDYGSALAQTNAQANASLARLPPGVLPPSTFPFDPTGTMPLCIVSVTGKGLGEARLKDLTKYDIRARLQSVPGSEARGTFGGKDRAIMVYLDPNKLEARGLAPNDVVNALARGNLLQSPGVAKFGGLEFQLDTNSLVRSVRELDDFPIRPGPNNAVFLRNVGRAEDANTIQTSFVRIDGQRTVYQPINRILGASSLSVVDGVRDKLAPTVDAVKSAYGEDVELKVVMDQSFYVREAIHALVSEGVVGAVLVALMILVFLGNWRMTLIASLSIPLAILGAVTGLSLFGQTLNIMTLAGLSLAIGPLVDDAVVELENNHRNYRMGKSRLKAAIDGCSEVLVPVLVATATTVIVLVPIALMPGLNGQLFRPLTLAVAFAMMTSFLLSRTFVPMMCAKFLPDDHRGVAGQGSGVRRHSGLFQRLHERFDNGLIGVTNRYRSLLLVALRHRWTVLAAVALVFAGSLTLLRDIGREFFPASDAGQITIYFRAPSGTNLEATERRVVEFEQFLREQVPAGDLGTVIAEVGLFPDYTAAYTANSATWDATFRVQLTEGRSRSAQETAAALRQAVEREPRFNDLRLVFNTGGLIQSALDAGAICPIDVQVKGGTRDEAMAAARAIRDRLARVPGTADVHVRQRDDAPQRLIEVDRPKAAEVGLSEADVIAQVTAAMNSSQYIKRNFFFDRKSGTQYWISVQYPEDPNMRLEDVLNVDATGVDPSRTVRLNSLVRIRPDSVPVEVNHEEFVRVIDVMANTEGRDLGSVAADVRQALDELRDGNQLPESVRVEVRGQYGRMQEAFGRLGSGLALAALFVYFLLVGLFRSFRGPLVIMMTVPLGLVGVLTTLYLTNTTLNVQSGMGMIFLVGIAVNNGVLLVDFANGRRRKGESVREAIVSAATLRFRPILMTFLATFLDLLPMAIGFGRGSEANVPLGRAVVGGLLASTLLTLFVVPIVYSLLMRDVPDNQDAIDREVDELAAAPA